MIKKSRLLLKLLIPLITCLFVCICATSDEPVSVVLDGRMLEFDVQPTVTDGRTMVPLRVILEELGAKVEWDAEKWTVKASKDGISIETVVGSRIILVNGSDIRMDAASTIIRGRTLVPVRFISEAFGCEVDWDDYRRIVFIYSDPGYAAYNESKRANDGKAQAASYGGFFVQSGIAFQDGDLWLGNPNDVYFKSGKADSALPPGGK